MFKMAFTLHDRLLTHKSITQQTPFHLLHGPLCDFLFPLIWFLQPALVKLWGEGGAQVAPSRISHPALSPLPKQVLF